MAILGSGTDLLVSLFISLWCFTSLLSSVSFSILEKDWFLKSCCEGFLEKPMRREFLLDVAMFFNQGSGVTADVEVVQLLNINRLAIRLAVTTSAFACLNCKKKKHFQLPAIKYHNQIWSPSRLHHSQKYHSMWSLWTIEAIELCDPNVKAKTKRHKQQVCWLSFQVVKHNYFHD